jgi:hypothetical protein
MDSIKIGQRVKRKENREITGAVIINFYINNEGETIVEIKYDEGGSGWWPIDCLELEETN